MGRSIPDRWLEYSSYGQPLISKFVALKVPLASTTAVPPRKRFTPEDAIKNLSLGLIIDLTNTSRYYQPSDFTSRAVEHVKLAVRGHVVPSMRIVERFNDIVRGYFNVPGHDGKLIGVHCTHGLNRTGYLICAYMILEEGFQPMEAINLFNTMRGHNMERRNYLQSLRSMVPGRNVSGPRDHVIPRKYSMPSGQNYRAPISIPHRAANGQRSAGNGQHRAANGQHSAGDWREDNFRRMYSEQPRRFDMATRRFDTETIQQHGSTSGQYDVASQRFDDNHRYSRPSQGDYQERWDPTIRRIVRPREHNYRLPSHRQALGNETIKHVKFN